MDFIDEEDSLGYYEDEYSNSLETEYESESDSNSRLKSVKSSLIFNFEYEKYDHTEGYTKFDEIPIMTITMIGYFDGKLSEYDDLDEGGNPITGSVLKKLHHLLPIMRTDTKKPTRLVKKITLRYPGAPWIIMTSNLNGEIRGVVKTTGTGKWPNSIMVDMSVPNKMINFRLSPGNIHMCGCKSIEMGKIASRGLLNYVNYINNSLILIDNNREDANRIAAEIIYDCTVPGKFEQDESDDYLYAVFDPGLVKNRNDNEIQERIRTFLSMEIGDLIRVDYAQTKLEWVLSLKPLFDREFDIESWYVCLTKYRFKLGFKINLSELVKIIYDEYPIFFADYHSYIQDYVKMEIFDPQMGVSCKNYAKHTFNIQSTGEVTYNSPNIENSNAIYNLFINTISEIRSDIEIEN